MQTCVDGSSPYPISRSARARAQEPPNDTQNQKQDGADWSGALGVGQGVRVPGAEPSEYGAGGRARGEACAQRTLECGSSAKTAHRGRRSFTDWRPEDLVDERAEDETRVPKSGSNDNSPQVTYTGLAQAAGAPLPWLADIM